jgi:heme exporter protein C
MVYLSNRLWRTQHPQPVILGGEGSGLDPTMARVLLLCVIAVFAVMIPLLIDRYRLEIIRHDLDGLRQQVESRSLGIPSASTESQI